MRQYRIMCEECDMETHVIAEDMVAVEFCPACGRRAIPEDLSEVDDI